MHINDLFSLRGKVALVTGGTERLGYYSAQALAEAGATVILTSRDPNRARKAASSLAKGGAGTVEGIALDPTDEAMVLSRFRELADRHGRLDVLVNNASGRGTTLSEGAYAYGRPEDQPLAHWEYTLRHNLTSTFLCAKHALPILKKNDGGSVINMSSVSSLVGRDRAVYRNSPELVPNTADYTAAKAGIIGFTVDLAAQVGQRGIRVNALLPGGFRRDTHPPEFVREYSQRTMLGRMGEFSSDLKGAIVFLASEASRYMTGQTLVVDGGFLTFR